MNGNSEYQRFSSPPVHSQPGAASQMQESYQRFSSPPINHAQAPHQPMYVPTQQPQAQQQAFGSTSQQPYGQMGGQQQQQQQQWNQFGMMNDATAQMGMQFGRSAVMAGQDYVNKNVRPSDTRSERVAEARRPGHATSTGLPPAA